VWCDAKCVRASACTLCCCTTCVVVLFCLSLCVLLLLCVCFILLYFYMCAYFDLFMFFQDLFSSSKGCGATAKVNTFERKPGTYQVRPTTYLACCVKPNSKNTHTDKQYYKNVLPNKTEALGSPGAIGRRPRKRWKSPTFSICLVLFVIYFTASEMTPHRKYKLPTK
jgi:hypothetical protein